MNMFRKMLKVTNFMKAAQIMAGLIENHAWNPALNHPSGPIQAIALVRRIAVTE
jgi:hypothetical protein